MTDAFIPSDPNAQFSAWKQDVDERLRMLETSAPLTNSSIRGGALTVKDADGVQTAKVGTGEWTDSDGGTISNTIFAINAEGSGGLLFLLDAEHGIVSPVGVLNWNKGDFVVVTSGTYVNTWQTQFVLTGTVLRVNLVVAADAATTGDVKLLLNGVTSTAVHTVAASTALQYQFDWDLDGVVSLMQTNVVQIQARRLTGAGNINVYAPLTSIVLAGPLDLDAVADGVI